MPELDSQQVLSLSAPAILIVWTLREVFSYLIKTQTLRKEQNDTTPNELTRVLKDLAENIEKQTSVLHEIYLELRENSVRLENLDKQVSQLPRH